MTDGYYLSIDVGTSAIKVVLYDLNFHMISKASYENVTFFPKPTWAEQDPNYWYSCVKAGIKKVIKRTKVDPKKIKGIGTCGEQQGIVFVDRKCTPLNHCIIWPDLRAINEAEEINRNLGIDINTLYSPSKLLWIKRNHPRLIDKAYKMLFVKDFIRAKLSNTFCTDSKSAASASLYDPKNGCWIMNLINYIGLPPEILPEVNQPETIVGEITDEVANETGLSAGTPVIAGYGDGSLEPVIMALKLGNALLIYLGTAPGILVSYSKEQKPIISVSPHFTSLGEFMCAGGGALLKWFQEQFCPIEGKKAEKLKVSPYALLDKEASKVPPGSEGLIFLPFMMGDYQGLFYPLNPYSRGIIFGLTLGHKRIHIYRSALEGITYSLRRIWDAIKDGEPDVAKRVDKAVVFGGGANSKLWMEIIANVFNLPVYKLNNNETATLNVACLISVGLGNYKNLLEAAEHANLMLIKVTEPMDELVSRYGRFYELYKSVCDIIGSLFKKSYIDS